MALRSFLERSFRVSRRYLLNLLGAGLLSLLLLQTPLKAEPRIRLTVNPLVGFAYATIKVDITVYDFPAKAAINLSIYGPEYQAVSVLQLDEPGGSIRIIPTRFYPLDQAGNYHVVAQLETGEFLRENGRVQVHASNSMTVELS